jgi:hypothetical protein
VHRVDFRGVQKIYFGRGPNFEVRGAGAGCCTNADMFKGTNADVFKGTNADLFKGTNADKVFKRTIIAVFGVQVD